MMNDISTQNNENLGKSDDSVTKDISNKKNLFSYMTTALIVITGIFQLYTAAFGIWERQKPVHLILFLLIIFCTQIDKDVRAKKYISLAINALCFVASLAAGIFLIYNYNVVGTRLGRGDIPDIVFGIMIIIVIMVSAYKTLGYVLPLISGIFILYGLFGMYFPGLLQHRGIRFARLVTYLPFSNEGIMGAALATSAKFIVLFIIFGACLEVSGGGQFFIDFANSLMGHKRGGPAKTAVLASGLMGSISGSAIANVAGTGVFTIPLMKKTGYSPEFAGAVEASASTGGQFTPPILASVAFIVAELLGVAYIDVVIASILPALLFYYCIFINVDMEATSKGLVGLPKESLPRLWPLIKGNWYLMLPIVLLVYALGVAHLSAQRSGIYAIVCAIVLSWFRKNTRVGLKEFFHIIQNGIKGSMSVVAACACSGIIVGVVTGTGLGTVLARLIVDYSMGSLALALIFTMLTTILLGMGMPTIPAYLIPAVTLVPPLVEMGANPMAAHLFIVFFAAMSGLTPPVALTSYTAAGLAKADVWKTSMIAVQIALAGFTLPYVFAFEPALLLNGTLVSILLAFAMCVFGLTAVAACFRGRLFSVLNTPERIACLASGILLIEPNYLTSFVGISLLIIVGAFSWRRRKKTQEAR